MSDYTLPLDNEWVRKFDWALQNMVVSYGSERVLEFVVKRAAEVNEACLRFSDNDGPCPACGMEPAQDPQEIPE